MIFWGKRVLVAAVGVLLMCLLTAAAPLQVVPPHTATEDTTAEEAAAEKVVESNAITINRWGDATSSFDANPAFGLQEAAASVSRDVFQSQHMQFGNMWWQLAADVTTFSSSVSLIEPMVWPIDLVAAQILKAMTVPDGSAPNLLGILVIAAFIVIVASVAWRSRGFELVKRVMAAAMLIALVWTSAAALVNPETGPLSEGAREDYVPAVGTPSWVVVQTAEVMGYASNVLSSVVVETVDGGANWGDKDRLLGCANFLHGLEKKDAALHQQAVDGGFRSATRQHQIRTVVDRIWREAGLRTWVDTQYGALGDAKYDMFCHHLDAKASGVTPREAREALRYTVQVAGEFARDPLLTPNGGGGVSRSSVLNPDSGDARMSSVLGWSLCHWGLEDGRWVASLDPKWEGFNEKAGSEPWSAEKVQERCEAWRKATVGDSWTQTNLLKDFHVHGTDSAVNENTDGMNDPYQAEARSTLANLLGTPSGVASSSPAAYMVASPFGVLPILVVAVGKLVAELLLVMMVLLLFASLVGGLFSRHPFGEHVWPALRRTFVVAFVAGGMGLVLSVVLVVASALSTAWVFLAGSRVPFLTSVLTALSPLLAVFVLHWIWVKAFKAPSPFTVKGGLAWVKGAPAGLGALGRSASGGLVDRMAARAGGAVKGAANTGMRKLGNVALDELGVQPKSGMANTLRTTAAAAGAGAGGVLSEDVRAARPQLRETAAAAGDGATATTGAAARLAAARTAVMAGVQRASVKPRAWAGRMLAWRAAAGGAGHADTTTTAATTTAATTGTRETARHGVVRDPNPAERAAATVARGANAAGKRVFGRAADEYRKKVDAGESGGRAAAEAAVNWSKTAAQRTARVGVAAAAIGVGTMVAPGVGTLVAAGLVSGAALNRRRAERKRQVMDLAQEIAKERQAAERAEAAKAAKAAASDGTGAASDLAKDQ